MTKILEIKNCSQCPYQQKAGPYGKVMYRPYCSKAHNGTAGYLPYIEIPVRNTKRTRAQPTWEIPDWCPLE